jgi:hypothetical protein
LLLTHSDDDSRFGHERYGNLKFKYMQRLDFFKNGQRHASQELHAHHFKPDIHDDESMYSNLIEDQSSDRDAKEPKHIDAHSGHIDDKPQEMPKWAQSTLQGASDLVGDMLDHRRTKFQFEEPHHSLASTEQVMCVHCYMFKFQTLSHMRKLQGISSRTRLKI